MIGLSKKRRSKSRRGMSRLDKKATDTGKANLSRDNPLDLQIQGLVLLAQHARRFQ